MTILLHYTCLYLLIGCPIALVLDLAVINHDPEQEFTLSEKFMCIGLWPVMSVVFAYHFVKGFVQG